MKIPAEWIKTISTGKSMLSPTAILVARLTAIFAVISHGKPHDNAYGNVHGKP